VDSAKNFPGIEIWGQRNTSSGLAGSWLGGVSPTAVRIDGAIANREAAIEPELLVDSAGNGYAAYSADVASTAHPGFKVGDVFVRVMAAAAIGWGAEQKVSNAHAEGTSTYPKLTPFLAATPRAGTSDAVAVVFSLEHPGPLSYSTVPFPTAIYPDLWVAHTKNIGASWMSAQIGSVVSPAAAKQGFPAAVMRFAGGSIEAGIVWDDRIDWTAPGGGGATGFGAPETRFRKVVLP
jgi:hypothetical protein